MLEQNIFLIGFMGTGKSTVAAKLSKKLKMRQLEMDAMIAEQQQMSVSQIFEKHGEGRFRDLESGLLIQLQTEEPAVVSCGGGVVVRTENIGHMKKHGKVIWLTARPETVFERVKDSRERPLLNDNMNVDYIRKMMETRRERYEAAADFIIETDKKSPGEISREIMERLEVGQE